MLPDDTVNVIIFEDDGQCIVESTPSHICSTSTEYSSIGGAGARFRYCKRKDIRGTQKIILDELIQETNSKIGKLNNQLGLLETTLNNVECKGQNYNAKWEMHCHNFSDDSFYNYWCSNCHRNAPINKHGTVYFPFECPNCGALMLERDEE